MLLINSSAASGISVVTTSTAAIKVHASYVDSDLANPSVMSAAALNANINTATTTEVVPNPASGFRTVNYLCIENDSTIVSNNFAVVHNDGTTNSKLTSVNLLAGENLVFTADGNWVHHDANGGEYPPAGRGAFSGRELPFFKASVTPDASGYWVTSALTGGIPSSWNPGTPGLNGRVTDGLSVADVGCIPIPNAASGANFITRADMFCALGCYNVFFDVLWVNSGLVVTTTTVQTFTIPTLPARDVNGNTAGEGCMIGILATTSGGLVAVASNATITYTNSAGVAGRTATLVAIIGSQAPATPIVGTIIWFNLQAGDTGVGGGAAAVTLNTSWVSGTISVFIARQVISVPAPGVYVPGFNVVNGVGNRIYNNSCILHAMQSSSSTANTFAGALTVQEK